MGLQRRLSLVAAVPTSPIFGARLGKIGAGAVLERTGAVLESAIAPIFTR